MEADDDGEPIAVRLFPLPLVPAALSIALVSPAHRGHRLGLALKVRNHTELQRSHSERRIVHTWNAEQNTAMNAVNAELGFRPVELAQELQRRI